MPAYNPIVVNIAQPGLVIQSQDDTPYEEIVQSMMGNAYAIKSIYIFSQTLQQILNNMKLFKFDANGNIKSETIVPAADPYQFQNALNIKMPNNNYVLNGQTHVEVTIEPNSSLNIQFETLNLSTADFLNHRLDEEMVQFLKQYGFFENYNETIELTQDDNTKGQVRE